MRDTGYDWSEPLNTPPGRASGYSRQGSELTNAQYLDMVQPYSPPARCTPLLKTC